MSHSAESVSNMQVEQRRFFRFPVEGEAMLSLGKTGGMVRCQMIDISREGCRLRREADLVARLGMTVEVAFRLSGVAFRLAGELAWLAKNRIVGVRFERMSARQGKELAAVLGVLRQEMEARAGGQRATRPDAGQDAAKQPAGPEPASPEPLAAGGRERRADKRHKVDSYARLSLLSLHTRQRGRIQDVSLSGCRICTDEPLPVGVYRRVEVEFYIDGLPLLLPGVTQVLHDSRTVGIRFVEMTERKRAQLHTVIEEIEQHSAAKQG